VEEKSLASAGCATALYDDLSSAQRILIALLLPTKYSLELRQSIHSLLHINVSVARPSLMVILEVDVNNICIAEA
jgi:hypothetical protein